MRTINRYLIHDFLAIFALTLAIFTSVMCLGVVIKAIDVAARGVSGGFILRVFAYNVPFMLTFSIPMSTITTVLLLFGRLSFDGELTAMKASGISLWQIISPVLMVSIVLSVICFAINATVAPRCKHAVRTMLVDLGVEEPVNLLEPGRFVRDFPDLMIYVSARDGNKVEDVVVFVYEEGHEGPSSKVRAKSGELRFDKDAQTLVFDLYDVRIDQREKDKGDDAEKTHYISAKHYPVAIDMAKLRRKTVRKKVTDLVFGDLIAAIRDVRGAFPELEEKELERHRMSMLVEANKRLALSLSCFAFALLGVPLAMRSKRRESSVGIGISLLLVFFFYLFIIIAETLTRHPELRPDMIVWFPVIMGEILGFWMVKRAN
jgi:lipopolysaccharide export system permease protein